MSAMPAAASAKKTKSRAGAVPPAAPAGRVKGPGRIWPALQHIHQNPGQSGRQIAHAIGVKDEGQMSRLLHRLRHFDFIKNGAAFRQTAVWTITDRGIEALHIVGYYPYLTPSAINERLNEQDKL